MPNKPHPPRGGGGSKKPTPQQNGDDTSYIVFSNAKGEPKKGKKPDAVVNNTQGSKGNDKEKGKDQPGQPKPDEAPKKSDTRTLIGGASWTGKLPVNLLSEHCQKQGWGKPDYTRVGHQSERYELSSAEPPTDSEC